MGTQEQPSPDNIVDIPPHSHIFIVTLYLHKVHRGEIIDAMDENPKAGHSGLKPLKESIINVSKR